MKDNQNRRTGTHDDYTVIGYRQAVAAVEDGGVYVSHGGKHSGGHAPQDRKALKAAKKRKKKKRN